ncbi:hypothetical protein BT63DRAFT_423191 [Microthyrium microscopicum]|uniref:Uncharacterized protein n=1 Tax=Microthyrium microscopicum TaxID=703497 RepID=A0A6A6UH89_9PEZI|nr:hypothetical protein BT63DRAFT_423191 [Microthyrium microscopicum]
MQNKTIVHPERFLDYELCNTTCNAYTIDSLGVTLALLSFVRKKDLKVIADPAGVYHAIIFHALDIAAGNWRSGISCGNSISSLSLTLVDPETHYPIPSFPWGTLSTITYLESLRGLRKLYLTGEGASNWFMAEVIFRMSIMGSEALKEPEIASKLLRAETWNGVLLSLRLPYLNHLEIHNVFGLKMELVARFLERHKSVATIYFSRIVLQAALPPADATLIQPALASQSVNISIREAINITGKKTSHRMTSRDTDPLTELCFRRENGRQAISLYNLDEGNGVAEQWVKSQIMDI